MRVHLCGVRGSTPAPGPDFVRYGGHTSCVAIARDGAFPSLVLDAGTGLRNLSIVLGNQSFRGSILLGHLHWDHVQGLPFFRGGDPPDSRIDVRLPEQEADAETLLERMMSPPTFPITPSQLPGNWSFGTLSEGQHTIEGFEVLAREIPHKGGTTFGYRVSDGNRAVAYLSDHHPCTAGSGPDGHGEYHEAAHALVDGVDLLIHDAQYTDAEYAARSDFGHATYDYALGLAKACGVGHLLLFHHDPARTDDELDRIVADLPAIECLVTAAVEGDTITL
jgi:phosphoribosyl 1,2-cyclic phosphodiesterase